MGRTVRVPLKDLAKQIEKDLGDLGELGERLDEAVAEALEDGVGIVWKRVPFAFGELHNSVHADQERKAIVADAPHAAPVEVGSIPHMPPIEPLVKWCEMRGFDDPERAAWAIAIKISREGSKPTFYMRGSLPELREDLGKKIRKALGK